MTHVRLFTSMNTHMNISGVFVLKGFATGKADKGSDTLVSPLMDLVVFSSQETLAAEGADKLLFFVAVNTSLVFVHEFAGAKPTTADITLMRFLTCVFFLVVFKCATGGE